MLRRRRRFKTPAFFYFWILMVLVTPVLLFYKIERALAPSVMALVKAGVTVQATDILNETLSDRILGGLQYRDLIHIEFDDRGRVVLMQPNTAAINRLQGRATAEVQEALKKLGAQTYVVPLGLAFGSKFLADYGPRIRATIYPAGRVRTDIRETFEAAGINQTRHVIYLEVEVTIQVAIPLYKEEIKVSNISPIAQAIVVGPVPETYVDVGLGR